MTAGYSPIEVAPSPSSPETGEGVRHALAACLCARSCPPRVAERSSEACRGQSDRLVLGRGSVEQIEIGLRLGAPFERRSHLHRGSKCATAFSTIAQRDEFRPAGNWPRSVPIRSTARSRSPSRGRRRRPGCDPAWPRGFRGEAPDRSAERTRAPARGVCVPRRNVRAGSAPRRSWSSGRQGLVNVGSVANASQCGSASSWRPICRAARTGSGGRPARPGFPPVALRRLAAFSKDAPGPVHSRAFADRLSEPEMRLRIGRILVEGRPGARGSPSPSCGRRDSRSRGATWACALLDGRNVSVDDPGRRTARS